MTKRCDSVIVSMPGNRCAAHQGPESDLELATRVVSLTPHPGVGGGEGEGGGEGKGEGEGPQGEPCV